jgi:hypothetical protein
LESLLEVFGEDGVGIVVIDAAVDVEGGRKRDPGPVSSDG